MATVFMKWLETSPKTYDRGIQLLTLGKLRRAHQQILSEHIQPGMRVLEIGCGTGALAVQMAEQSTQVVGVDISPQMLGAAAARVKARNLQDRISLKLMDAALVADTFQPHAFDLIVASLSLSEMAPAAQQYLLATCHELLAPHGKVVVVDEVRPEKTLPRLAYWLVRLPLVILTWLLTRTSTHPLKSLNRLLENSGYRVQAQQSFLLGGLVLLQAVPVEGPAPQRLIAGQLRYKPTLKTFLKDVLALFNRLIPPYPKQRPGLYRLGSPTPQSPVLVTCNFDLTVRRLTKALYGRVDAWVLVVDTAGINVWCAAGGGFFTAEKVVAAIKTSGLEQVVSHHSLILPQLAAPGVDGWKIRRLSGWGVHWGPVRAEDIPAYLEAGLKKTQQARTVTFPLADRLEMVTVTLAFYALMILLPVLVFWRELFWPVSASLLGLAYFYAVAHPALPGKDGLEKAIPLSVIALAGFALFTLLTPPHPASFSFNWALGLVGLAVFSSAEMQGMSPKMRGEQANWMIEGVIFAVLGLLFWLVPVLAGWK